MLDPNINVENYFDLLSDLSIPQFIYSKYERLTKVLSFLESRPNPSITTKQLTEYWSKERNNYTIKIKILQDIGTKKRMYSTFYPEHYCFIPSTSDIGEILLLKRNTTNTLFEDFNKKLEYPTLPIDQIIQNEIESLTYTFLDIYKSPTKRLIDSIYYPLEPFPSKNPDHWNTYIICHLAHDLATYELLHHLIKLKDIKEVTIIEEPKQDTPIEEVIFTSKEAKEQFFNTLTRLKYWNKDKNRFFSPDPHKTPSIIKEMILFFCDVGIIFDLPTSRQFKLITKALNLNIKEPRGGNEAKNIKAKEVKQRIEETLKELYPEIYQR